MRPTFDPSAAEPDASLTVRATPPLTQGRIWHLYWPLAASWLLMAVEAPISMAIIGRMPNERINAAALLVVFGLAILIESPVIDLLSTSTTLGNGRGNFLVIRRFTIWLIGIVTLVHLSIAAIEPLYNWIAFSVYGLEPDVAAAARTALLIMTPWSGFIGWRRHLHGVLIREGNSRPVTIGTALRLTTVATIGFGLLNLAPDLPSIQIVAIALVSSVGVESVFIHFVSLPVVRAAYDGDERPATIDMRRLIQFHLPLTASTAIGISSMALLSIGLSKAPDSVLQMAAWQNTMTLGFLLRTATFALPEVVISLYRSAQSALVLRAFCLRVGMALSVFQCLLTVALIDNLFYVHVLQVERSVAWLASLGLLMRFPAPLIQSASHYLRGMLTAHHKTMARLIAIVVAIAALMLGIFGGLSLGWIGVVAASSAVVFSMALEWLVLLIAWRRTRPNEAKY